MHELTPQGFSPVLTALLKVAQGHFPEAFDGERPDADVLGASLHLVLYGNDNSTIEDEHAAQVMAFGKAHGIVRRLASDGAFRLHYLDSTAMAQPIIPARYWATDTGNANLLFGLYSPDTWPGWRPLLIENAVIEKLIPQKAATKQSAKGRDTLTDRLRRHMIDHPVPDTPKLELLARFADGLALSKRVKQAAWDDAAKDHPAYTKAGPRPKAKG